MWRLRLSDDPEIIYSHRCTMFSKDDRIVEVNIFRLKHEQVWHLEVVNEQNSSTVWDDPFDTDDAAYEEFLATVRDEGMVAFEDVPTVLH
jgi:hypothetical protein